MLRFVIIALVTLNVVLLTALALSPANAASRDYEQYMWSFAGVGSNQLVCKQVAIHPDKELQSRDSSRKVIQMYSNAQIVSDRHCANLAKPF